MDRNEFANLLAKWHQENDFDQILGAVHGIGLPEGWKDMVKPFFEDFLGRSLEAEVIPAAEIPDHQRAWLDKAPPEIKEKLEWAVKLKYEEIRSEKDQESADLVLPIIEIDGNWRILMVGGGE